MLCESKSGFYNRIRVMIALFWLWTRWRWRLSVHVCTVNDRQPATFYSRLIMQPQLSFIALDFRDIDDTFIWPRWRFGHLWWPHGQTDGGFDFQRGFLLVFHNNQSCKTHRFWAIETCGGRTVSGTLMYLWSDAMDIFWEHWILGLSVLSAGTLSEVSVTDVSFFTDLESGQP